MSRKKCTIEHNFFSRLFDLMGSLGYGKREQFKFAEKLNISATYLSGIFKQKKNPSFDMIYAIANNFPGVNIQWLLTGEGEMLQRENEIIIEAKPRVVVLTDKMEMPREGDFDEYLAVPLVKDRIAAGQGRVVREEIRSLVWVYRPEVGRRRNLVAVQLGKNEKSMRPTIDPGAIVILDRDDHEYSEKAIYAVRTDGDVCAIKRLHLLDDTILLLSDNPKFQPAKAYTSDLSELIVGRVIWMWKSFL